MKQGSWKSKEMGYADLPKACKVLAAAAQGLVAGFAVVAMDTLKFNYGPYTFNTGGAGFPYTTVVVQEPGVYGLLAGGRIVAGNLHIVSFSVNGALGVTPFEEYGQQSINATYDGAQVSGVTELKAGDTVALGIYNDVSPVNTIAGACWLYVEKKGG